MTRERIHFLLKLYPKSGNYVAQTKVPELLGITQLDYLDRMGTCMYDPAFGYNFVRAFVAANRPMPDLVVDDALCRLFAAAIEKEYDPDLLQAVTLEKQPGWRNHRNLVQAGLLDANISIKALADFLHLDSEVIRLYDQLFFNVRDRLDEASYIGFLAYPEGTQVELREDYSTHEPLANLMKRASYNHGFAVAASLAFKKQDRDPASNSLLLAEDVKVSILKDGSLKIKCGMINQKEMTNVMRLLTAQAVGGKEDADTTIGLQGLSGLSMGRSIMDVVKGLQAPDIVNRRLLQQAFVEAEDKRKQAEKAEATPIEV